MEAGSEGEKKKPPEGENKTKRKMKTASQLEILEKTYAAEAYPSEAVRAELSVKLGLSDRQLQMWFCHRRLKDRKAPAAKKQRNNSPPVTVTPTTVGEVAERMTMGDAWHECGSVSGLRPFGHLDLRRVVPRSVMAFPRVGGGLPAMDSYYGPQQSIAELRAVAFVEAQLGEPLREDGPILGMEFDPLPPDAFGAPIGVTTMPHQQSGRPFEAKIYERLDKGVSRTLHEYQFIPEQPTVRNETYERVASSNHCSSVDGIPHSRTSSSAGRLFLDGNETTHYGFGFQGHVPGLNLLSQQGRQNHLLASAPGENDGLSQKSPFVDVTIDTHAGPYPVTQIDSPIMPSDRKVIHEEELSRFQRKRKNEEARMQRELEVHEKRIRKELEKQDILRRKREEQIRKEMERHDRGRRKEEERLMRERQREEERYQKEQRRELERREKFLQKESIRAEKMRQKEELRREKEAARIKAANERAITRRMAKESMELIEDERLEFMELAASKKGLSSILSLDYETLQNLELYRDRQTSFPPKCVQLKRPFSFQPWSDSEEHVGKLLMVWRFLITFADVLGMWPFTLDEFVQAFHDYDPRLLGEIHIALLRSITKDIEDVFRIPTAGVGANQNSAANPGGGHPQVVEGAYMWGFDIRNWQRHLNPLTWPEILRQLALSAGFGPQLKKRNTEHVYPCDNNEGNNGEDIISNLRSGAAVENAVAIMREKGLSNLRRSRHRLTPGTVKYAAFHVLSFEGSKGLTILDVADKIQKSGLRDLTTSKTPEASIAAALSRDTKLFERTAPSTYCVRPPYRKDPADAEAILSAARERIRIFKSGIVNTEERDDGERDEDSESDVAEDPEVDDLVTATNAEDKTPDFEKVNANAGVRSTKDSGDFLQTLDGGDGKVSEGLALIVDEGFSTLKDVRASGEKTDSSNDLANPDVEDTDIDENNPGEQWVHGLMEGEYSDLSVEERLNALVALIGLAIEGNSIRVVLEERLEAANCLKKQMWAELQLDKSRIKEDYFVKLQPVPYMGNKNESTVTILPVEGKQSPSHTLDDKNDKALLTRIVHQEQLNDLQSNQTHLQSLPAEVNLQMQDYSTNLDNYSFQQSGYAAEKLRSNLKSYIGHLAEETYMYRSLPLGLDRRRNRYWRFITSASQNDPGCGRIFVELHGGQWRMIDTEEGFDALLASLDIRGIRESHLHTMLQRIEMSFKDSVRRNKINASMKMQNRDTFQTEPVEMDRDQDRSANIHSPNSVCIANSDLSETSTSFVVQLGGNEADNKDSLWRYQDLEKWMQKECLNLSILCAMKFGKKRCSQLLGMCDYCHDVIFSEEIQCPSCRRTFHSCKSNLGSSEHVTQCEKRVKITTDDFHIPPSSPLRMRLLKVLLAIVEAFIPHEAIQPHWTESYRKSWSTKLHVSSSSEDLLQILTVLEGAIKREYLASDFETTSELLGSLSSSGCFIIDFKGAEKIPVLPWVPHTTAAAALRLLELDASTFYASRQKVESEKEKRIGHIMKLPPKYASAKNFHDAGATETSHQTEHNWVDLGAGLSNYSRGQRSRGQGRGRSRRPQGRVISSRSKSRKRVTATGSSRLGQVIGWKGKSSGQGGHSRGRRSIRSRQKPAIKVREISVERNTPNNIVEESPGISVGEEINESQAIGFQMEVAENASSPDRSDYEDGNYQATVFDYDYLVNNNGRVGFSGKSENVVEGSHYNVDDEEDEDIGDGDNDDKDDGQDDLDVEDYMNGDSDIGENGGDSEQNMDVDSIGSISSDYSD